MEDYYPEKINKYFEDEVFVYANVPYKIKPYEDLLKDPKILLILMVIAKEI